MLISKFDLYKTEWLDLVFDTRNKQYGAYQLRQHYGQNMARAMAITFFAIAAAVAIGFALHKQQLADPVIIVDTMIAPPPLLEAKKKIEPLKPKQAETIKANPVTTSKYVPMVVKPDIEAQTPPRVDELKGAIGQTDVKAPGGNTPATASVEQGASTGPAIVVDNTPIDAGSGILEVMPSPVGGAAAWSKFLQRNMRFPPAAQEEGISGRVFLSFIIEKNGEISNIVVERPAGHGFDEEAARVLKLAKAWKPGIQNGQPVRVKFVLPINFTAATSD